MSDLTDCNAEQLKAVVKTLVEGETQPDFTPEPEQPIYESAWRHKQMSNPDIKFFLVDNNIIHDKKCPYLKKIPDERLEGISEFRLGINTCSQCMRIAYARALAKDDSNIDELLEFLENTGFSLKI